MKRLAYINIILSVISLMLVIALPHHHHKTLLCTIEHICDSEPDCDSIYHDHEDHSAPFTNDDNLCPSHEGFRLPASQTHFQAPEQICIIRNLELESAAAITVKDSSTKPNGNTKIPKQPILGSHPLRAPPSVFFLFFF